jgi:hypothetical protein
MQNLCSNCFKQFPALSEREFIVYLVSNSFDNRSVLLEHAGSLLLRPARPPVLANLDLLDMLIYETLTALVLAPTALVSDLTAPL